MILAIGWTCYRCGIPLEIDGPNETGNLYIWPDSSKTKAICLNAQLCNGRKNSK